MDEAYEKDAMEFGRVVDVSDNYAIVGTYRANLAHIYSYDKTGDKKWVTSDPGVLTFPAGATCMESKAEKCPGFGQAVAITDKVTNTCILCLHSSGLSGNS